MMTLLAALLGLLLGKVLVALVDAGVAIGRALRGG